MSVRFLTFDAPLVMLFRLQFTLKHALLACIGADGSEYWSAWDLGELFKVPCKYTFAKSLNCPTVKDVSFPGFPWKPRIGKTRVVCRDQMKSLCQTYGFTHQEALFQTQRVIIDPPILTDFSTQLPHAYLTSEYEGWLFKEWLKIYSRDCRMLFMSEPDRSWPLPPDLSPAALETDPTVEPWPTDSSVEPCQQALPVAVSYPTVLFPNGNSITVAPDTLPPSMPGPVFSSEAPPVETVPLLCVAPSENQDTGEASQPIPKVWVSKNIMDLIVVEREDCDQAMIYQRVILDEHFNRDFKNRFGRMKQ